MLCSQHWLRDLDTKKIREVLERIGEKRALLNNILRRKTNWIGHILRKNCLLHDAIEGQMTEVKGVERTQLLDDLRNKRTYKELKEEAEDRNRWKRQLLIEHEEKIHILHKSMDLLISSIYFYVGLQSIDVCTSFCA